jgi:hypothetical protein
MIMVPAKSLIKDSVSCQWRIIEAVDGEFADLPGCDQPRIF